MPGPSAGHRRVGLPSGRVKTRHRIIPLLAVILFLAACSSDEGSGDAHSGGPTTVTGSPGRSDGADDTEPDDEVAGPDGPWADHRSEHYEDLQRWLCHPDLDEDVCDTDLDATVIRADGSREVERFEADPSAPIDCFYVYPTISQDESRYSDWDASADEEGWVTIQQAARLGSVCRVFAPIYRQTTLTALIGRMTGEEPPEEHEQEEGDPYADVLDAFRTYLSRHNDGRGVVLVGHSQGASILKRLLAEEFDPEPALRELLVGAQLAGTSVAVPEGELVGGDLAEIPLCRTVDETGCLTTWSTYAAGEVPDEGAIFGRTADDLPAGCVDPAAVEGGEVFLHPYLPAERGRSILGSGGGGDRVWTEDGEIVETPFVALPELVRGECTSRPDLTYLEVEIETDDDDPRVTDLGGRLTPEWGLHLLDVNLVMGDLVEQIRAQAEAWGAG